MNEKIRRVFYVNGFGLPLFAQCLAREPSLSLTGITAATVAATAREVLGQSHVYQVSSGVNDVPAKYLVTSDLLEQTPRLLMVSTIGAGYDTVDVAECTKRGIVVVNQTGGASAQAVVEHTLALMLALGKRIVEADRNMRRTADVVRGHFTGRNMHRKTLGLIGFGNVGQRLTAVCRQAFDMRVLVVTENSDAADVASHGAEKTSLPALLQQADYVVICCALTPRTKGLIGSAEFAQMQPHAYFVTTARAGIHDEAALLLALERKTIAGAGIDVWDMEPPPIDHPLLQLDNVIATPHTAGATLESRTGASESAARQIVQALSGQRPPRLLNPQVWPLFAERLASAFEVEVGVDVAGP